MEGSRRAALDLNVDAEVLLQAAEIALLASRLNCRAQLEDAGASRLPTRYVPKATPAAAWLNCIGRSFRDSITAESRLLVNQPGGGWTNWMERTAAPRCALEALALAAANFHLEKLDVTGRRAGAEWWVQVRDMDESMPVHWDCDEDLYNRTGDLASPYLATVTYLTSSGAPTIVLPVATDARGRGVAEPRGDGEAHGDGHGVYVSFPIAGKHLAFDGRLLHGTQRSFANMSPARFLPQSMTLPEKQANSCAWRVWQARNMTGRCGVAGASPLMRMDWAYPTARSASPCSSMCGSTIAQLTYSRWRIARLHCYGTRAQPPPS